jgi:hypothetical protein
MARSGDADLAMGPVPAFFCRSRVDSADYAQVTLIIPRRGVRFTFRQIGEEVLQQPMVFLQPVTTTRAVIDGAFRKTISRCSMNNLKMRYQ